MHVNVFMKIVSTVVYKELNILCSMFIFLKFCTIKYIIKKSLIVFFLKRISLEIVHNHVISTQSNASVV